jgi:hypothetical protein
MRLEFFQHIFEKYPNIKFYEMYPVGAEFSYVANAHTKGHCDGRTAPVCYCSYYLFPSSWQQTDVTGWQFDVTANTLLDRRTASCMLLACPSSSTVGSCCWVPVQDHVRQSAVPAIRDFGRATVSGRLGHDAVWCRDGGAYGLHLTVHPFREDEDNRILRNVANSSPNDMPSHPYRLDLCHGESLCFLWRWNWIFK